MLFMERIKIISLDFYFKESTYRLNPSMGSKIDPANLPWPQEGQIQNSMESKV